MSTEPKHTDSAAIDTALEHSVESRDTDEDAAFEELFRSLKKCGFGECIERLAYLRSTEDMEDDETPLLLESAKGFVALMNGFPDLGKPLLGLFWGGTLSVSWRIADNKHLAVEPLDAENASFALIGPAAQPGEEFRANGRGTIAEVSALCVNMASTSGLMRKFLCAGRVYS